VAGMIAIEKLRESAHVGDARFEDKEIAATLCNWETFSTFTFGDLRELEEGWRLMEEALLAGVSITKYSDHYLLLGKHWNCVFEGSTLLEALRAWKRGRA